jgi:hypothetical protein
MRPSCHCIVGLIGAWTLLAGWGCGAGGSAPAVSSSMTEATVSGTVTIKGKPATKGEVSFDPANVSRNVGARTAPIGADGTYTITTLVGGNVVRVATPETTKDPVLQYNETTFDVQSGTNQLDIVLPAPAP